MPRPPEFRCDLPTPELFTSLAAEPLPLGLVARGVTWNLYRDLYFDTSDGILAAAGVACRLRTDGAGRRTLSLGVAAAGASGGAAVGGAAVDVVEADLPAGELAPLLRGDSGTGAAASEPDRPRAAGATARAGGRARDARRLPRVAPPGLVRVPVRPGDGPARRPGAPVSGAQGPPAPRREAAARGAGAGARGRARPPSHAADQAAADSGAAPADGAGKPDPPARVGARRRGARAGRGADRAAAGRRGAPAPHLPRRRRTGGAPRPGRVVRLPGGRAGAARPRAARARPAEPRGVACPPIAARARAARRPAYRVDAGGRPGARGAHLRRGPPIDGGRLRRGRPVGARSRVERAGLRPDSRPGGARETGAGRGPDARCRLESRRVQPPRARHRGGRAHTAAGAAPLSRDRERQPGRAVHERGTRGRARTRAGAARAAAGVHRRVPDAARGPRAPAPPLGRARRGRARRAPAPLSERAVPAPHPARHHREPRASRSPSFPP